MVAIRLALPLSSSSRSSLHNKHYYSQEPYCMTVTSSTFPPHHSLALSLGRLLIHLLDTLSRVNRSKNPIVKSTPMSAREEERLQKKLLHAQEQIAKKLNSSSSSSNGNKGMYESYCFGAEREFC